MYLPNGRIKFESGLGKKSNSPSFGCIVINIGGNGEIIRFNLEDIYEI